MPFASKEQSREYRARWKKANRAKLRASDTAYQRRRYAKDAEYREHKKDLARRYTRSPKGRAADKENKARRRDYYLAYWREYSKRRVRTAARREYERQWESKPNVKRRRAEQKRLGGHVAQKRRRANTRGSPGTLTEKEWKTIKAAYKSRCAYCGRKHDRLTQDHVLPLGAGPHAAINVIPACRSCNSKKQRRSLSSALVAVADSPEKFWKRQAAAWRQIQERLGI